MTEVQFSERKRIFFFVTKSKISPTPQSSEYQQPHLTTVNQTQREAKHSLSPLNVWSFTSALSILLDCECSDTGSDVCETELPCSVATVQASSVGRLSYPEADSPSAGQQICAFHETLKFITVFTTSVTCLYLQPFQNPLILILFEAF